MKGYKMNRHETVQQTDYSSNRTNCPACSDCRAVSSGLPGSCPYSVLKQATTVCFHIVVNSSFTVIQCAALNCRYTAGTKIN